MKEKQEECGTCAEEDEICSVYSKEAMEHFTHPKNSIAFDKKPDFKPDGTGVMRGSACGDVIKSWMKLDNSQKRIVKYQWQSFGCAAALASASMLSVMVTEKGGMLIEDALKLKPGDVVKRLCGLPKVKVHCSVLSIGALRAAIEDFRRKKSQVHYN